MSFDFSDLFWIKFHELIMWKESLNYLQQLKAEETEENVKHLKKCSISVILYVHSAV